MINPENIIDLKVKGFTYLDAIDENKWKQVLEIISKTETEKTYSGDFIQGETIANLLNLSIERIAELHEEIFAEKIKDRNFYSVLRIVRDRQNSEALRMHFDSHRFTIVIPIEIPLGESKSSGELITFPKIRSEPNNIFFNILGKIYTKIFSINYFFNYLLKNKNFEITNFKNNRPILFLGRQTLHGNFALKLKSSEKRITLLLHYFDPEGNKGLGGLMRSIRKNITR